GSLRELASRGDPYWVRVSTHAPPNMDVLPVLIIHAGRLHQIRVYPGNRSSTPALVPAARAPEFVGAVDTAYILPSSDSRVYVHIQPPGPRFGTPRMYLSTLEKFLAESASRTRTITLAFGALISMAFAGLLIWLLLAERAFLLYF